MHVIHVVQDYRMLHVWFVESFTKPGVFYMVDMERLVCNCRGWRFGPKNPENHKHIKLAKYCKNLNR